MADEPTLLAAPITIGELTDVPAPLSPIAAQFHQEVANRIVHRFATAAAMNAWAAADGSLAWCAELTRLFLRFGAQWWQIGLQGTIDLLSKGLVGRAVGVYGQDINGVPALITGLSITFTADPARWYRTRFTVPEYLAGGANPMIGFAIVNASQTVVAESRFTVAASQNQRPVTIEAVEHGLTGPTTRSALCNAAAAGVVQLYFPGDNRAALYPFMTVEDLGAG